MKISGWILMACVFTLQLGFSQTPFPTNPYGEVTDGSLSKIIKQRQYQLVSAFDTVAKSPALVYAQYLKNGKFGIIDNTGKEITPAIYETIDGLDRGITPNLFAYPKNYIVKENGLYGLISNKGRQLLPNIFKRLYYRHGDSLLTAVENEFERVIDENGKTVEITNAEEKQQVYIPEFENVLSADQKQYTIKNTRKNTVISVPNYGKIEQQYGNKIKFKSAEGKFGIYDATARKMMVPIAYDDANFSHAGMYIVKNGHRFGLVDSLSQVKLPIDFETFSATASGFYGYKNNQYSIYDKTGEKIDVAFDKYAYLGPKGMIISQNGKFGLVTAEGKAITGFAYDQMSVPQDNDLPFPIILVIKNGKTGVIDFNGKVLCETVYDLILPESLVFGDKNTLHEEQFGYANQPNRFHFVAAGSKYGLVDNDFKPMTPLEYDYLLKSNDRTMLYAKKAGKWGMIDAMTQKTVIPFVYDFQPQYRAGNFLVLKDKQYGLCGRDGKFILPLGTVTDINFQTIYKGLWRASDYSAKSAFYFDYSGRRTIPLQWKN